MQVLEEEDDVDDLYIHFADFEEFCKETERARAIYRYALDHVPRSKVDELYSRFVTFEKKQGSRSDIEDVLLSKKRLQVLLLALLLSWHFVGIMLALCTCVITKCDSVL